jgi:hypothetical protein
MSHKQYLKIILISFVGNFLDIKILRAEDGRELSSFETTSAILMRPVLAYLDTPELMNSLSCSKELRQKILSQLQQHPPLIHQKFMVFGGFKNLPRYKNEERLDEDYASIRNLVAFFRKYERDEISFISFKNRQKIKEFKEELLKNMMLLNSNFKNYIYPNSIDSLVFQKQIYSSSTKKFLNIMKYCKPRVDHVFEYLSLYKNYDFQENFTSDNCYLTKTQAFLHMTYKKEILATLQLNFFTSPTFTFGHTIFRKIDLAIPDKTQLLKYVTGLSFYGIERTYKKDQSLILYGNILPKISFLFQNLPNLKKLAIHVATQKEEADILLKVKNNYEQTLKAFEQLFFAASHLRDLYYNLDSNAIQLAEILDKNKKILCDSLPYYLSNNIKILQDITL